MVTLYLKMNWKMVVLVMNQLNQVNLRNQKNQTTTRIIRKHVEEKSVRPVRFSACFLRPPYSVPGATADRGRRSCHTPGLPSCGCRP